MKNHVSVTNASVQMIYVGFKESSLLKMINMEIRLIKCWSDT